MGVARRLVSSHVFVRAKSERSDWSCLELKMQNESIGRINGLIPDEIALERSDSEKKRFQCNTIIVTQNHLRFVLAAILRVNVH